MSLNGGMVIDVENSGLFDFKRSAEADGAHGAIKDAMDTLAVYRHLQDQGVDLTPEVHHSNKVEEIRSAG